MVISFKSLAVGALVMFVGYWLCMALLGVASALDSSALRLGSGVVAVALVAFTGFLGALFAKASPLLNGVLAGLVGAAILLSFFTLLAPPDADLAYIGPSLSSAALAFVGSLVAVYVWPRHGR